MSNPSKHILIVVIFLLSINCSIHASTLLYSNDFESPVGFIDTSNVDVSQQNINSLYGFSGFFFQELNTVETLEINGGVAFNGGYSDPAGIGGNHALGMLSTVEDDRLSLTFNVGTNSFLNVRMDISAIDLDGVGGPFGVAQPRYRVSLYDSPMGSFNISTPGTLLDQIDVIGTGAVSQSTFNWTRVIAPLSTAGNTDGNVSVVFDLIESGYAAFDNIEIDADDVPGTLVEAVTVPNPLWLILSLIFFLSVVGIKHLEKY